MHGLPQTKPTLAPTQSPICGYPRNPSTAYPLNYEYVYKTQTIKSAKRTETQADIQPEVYRLCYRQNLPPSLSAFILASLSPTACLCLSLSHTHTHIHTHNTDKQTDTHKHSHAQTQTHTYTSVHTRWGHNASVEDAVDVGKQSFTTDAKDALR